MLKRSHRRYLLLNVLSIMVLLFGNQGLASAHILRQDQGIAAEMHIPPDDHPVAGQPTELDFSFGDDTQKFSLQNCNCQVSVKQGGKVTQRVQPRPAVKAAPLDAIAVVNFPKIGTYDIVFTGQSKNGSFPAFSLTYPARVATAVKVASKNRGPILLLLGVGAVAILALLVYNYKTPTSKRPKRN